MEVGAVVRMYDDHDYKGTVIGNKVSDGDEVVAIEWDNGVLSKENVNDLKLVSLDNDFEIFQAKLMEKIYAASALLNEANEMAKTRGKSIRDLEWDNEGETGVTLYPIFQQIKRAGWSTSSLGC